MPIFGYLAYPRDGAKEKLLEELNNLEYCQVVPADNADLLAIVTDTPNEESEKILQNKLNSLNSLEFMNLTFANIDENNKEFKEE